MGGEGFGDRLRQLIDDRCGSYEQFAHDLGISNSYLDSLMGESIAVSNPRVRLLQRMALRLNERVSYLVGDSDESDSIWIESHAAWRSYVRYSGASDQYATSRESKRCKNCREWFAR